MILIQTSEGIANRLRVIASGLSLARDLNKKLVIIWPISLNLNCGYLDLFIPPQEFIIIEKSITSKFLLYKNSNNLLRKLLYNIYSFVFSYNFILLNSEIPEKVWELPSNRLSKKNIQCNVKNIFISTSEEFYENSYAFYTKIIKPIDFIQKKIDLIIKEISQPFIGLHIRRTDHLESTEISRTELFIEVIKQELIKVSNVMFYLSTDSLIEAKKIINLFGSNRIYYNEGKNLQRNSLEGIQQALIDLIILSKSYKIYGSYRSSFSELASTIGNIKLVIVK